jgi:predicted TIM-barrel fold metal-dependent hydrolase
VLLSVDMDHMEAGKAPHNFIHQIEQLALLRKKFPDNIYPFIGADPRRSNFLDLVKKYIETEGFKGIKLYPPLGFYPFDKKLHSMYNYAEKNAIPILVHCKRQSRVYFKGRLPDDWLIHPRTGKRLERKPNAEFTQTFTDPDNYVDVLDEFKQLKLCFGHFGGEKEWHIYEDEEDPKVFEQSWFFKIRQLLRIPQYVNTFADISYTLADMDLVPLLNVTIQIPELRAKILYGSDFYFADIEGTEWKFGVHLRKELGEDNFRQIAELNPKKFLG